MIIIRTISIKKFNRFRVFVIIFDFMKLVAILASSLNSIPGRVPLHRWHSNPTLNPILEGRKHEEEPEADDEVLEITKSRTMERGIGGSGSKEINGLKQIVKSPRQHNDQRELQRK